MEPPPPHRQSVAAVLLAITALLQVQCDGPECSSRTRVDCECSDTLLGYRICGPDGSFGACMCSTVENTDLACSDGIDNDGNGFTDCADFACRISSISVCSDGGP